MPTYELFLLFWAFHGWIGLSYSFIADKRRWDKIPLFEPSETHLDAISKSSFVQVPFSLGLAWASGGTFLILFILFGSYFMALFATEFFKSSIQWVWVSLYVLWLGTIPFVYYLI